MKRTNRLTNIVSALLFIAFALYAAAYAYRTVNDNTVTAEAVYTSVSVGGSAGGIVLRNESVLRSSEPYIDITAQDGERVAVGSQLALAMNSSAGLERSARMHQLELEIERMKMTLGELNSSEDLTARDNKLRSAVLELTASVARSDYSRIDGAALSLGSLLFPDSGEASEQQLQAMERELYSLRNSSSSDTRLITAEKSGLFFSSTDGYENLSPEVLAGLTPEKLQQLIDSRSEPYSDAFGKLVTGYRWYFAAVVDRELGDRLEAGDRVTLDFGRYYGGGIEARVESLSQDYEGKCAAVFSCSTAMAETLAMREASAEVSVEEHKGIRVPAQAIRTDSESESTYVWVITAMQLERKEVTVIYAGEGYAIVEREAAPDSLREGNTIVVSGSDLYEGKLME